ncbi:MAG: nuclear transport factor 2 family protein [Ruminococcaceae bacterium]|nr:nuclear transport factor 2 family protein [Oscillospiraceae bacterium]
MKKLVCIALAVMCLLMAGCNFNTNFSNNGINVAQMEATPQVGQMLNALAAKDVEAALALMHPSVVNNAQKKENVKAMLQQMMNFVDGRDFQALSQRSLNVKSSIGSQGNVKQEVAMFQVNIGEEVCYLSVTSVTQDGKTGFTSYQLVLGVV